MPEVSFKVTSKILTFEFENEEMAHHFKLWLCEAGEQGYWEWMGYREEENPGKKITAKGFNYWLGNLVVGKAK